jgi:diguanylate cyclase (GGDEF)-like protein/PAS domain S-box-containing protein
MSFLFAPLSGIYLISGIISLFVAIQASRRRNVPGINEFILWMCVVAEWNFAITMESGATNLGQKILWSNLSYLGSLSAAPLFLIFVLVYTQRERWLNRRNVFLICSLLVVTLLVIETNDWHQWVWGNIQEGASVQGLIVYERHLGFYFISAYSYFCLILGMILLAITYMEANEFYREQMGLLLMSCLIPLISSLVYGIYLPRFVITSVAYSISSVFLSINIRRYNLFDLIPMARQWIIEEMSDAVIVLDLKNRLVDINPAAERILGTLARKSLGKPATRILSRWPLLLERSHDLKNTQAEIQMPGTTPKTFDVRSNPLFNNKKKLVGRLISFRDMTRRKATEATLARYGEEIGIIDRISLAITTGLDLDQVLRTLHQQCSQVVLFDIFYVALYNKSSLTLSIPIYYENGKYQVGPSRHITEYPEIITKVMQSRQTMYLHDIPEHNSGSLIHFDSQTMRSSVSYVGIPLTVRDEIIGILSFQSRISNAYSDEEIRLLERIAIQAAIAIENARLYSEVQRLADIDELTGIYNYRGLQELGSREVERARRFDHPLTALFIDVDDLRKFNNLYSHGIGNLVLQMIVNRCKIALRSVDVFARFGGDEFVVLLPETDFASASAIANRLTNEIAATPINTSYGELHVNVSIGVNALTRTMPGLAALIEGANQAEHIAKTEHKKKQADSGK